jgi:putative nucleotidyltransferase with HDIG domain
MNWGELKQASLAETMAWAESQPWCQAMAECAQDAQWHAEGDVWTHTKMVCRQLTELAEWPSLTNHERTLLIFTALFHDVAKPLTSQVDPDSGRISSPKHAVKGEQVARGVLRELGCDLTTREEIARLVRFHGRPAFLMQRSEPSHEVARMSWHVDNRLLYLFALADTRGRYTESMDRPEENLHYWKLQAEETGCFNQPYPFDNDHARFLFFRQREPNLHYVPHEDFRCRVTVLSGLPGSGKDSWLSSHRPDLAVVSLDGVRNELGVSPTDDQGKVVQLARQRCRELLRDRTSFAFNATNILKQTRGRWIDLFNDYDAHIELVYVEPDFERLLKQNKDRDNAVPEQVVRKLAAKTEPPTWAEGHALILSDGVRS